MNELKNVLGKFPDCASEIHALAKRDAAFGAILADYEETCTWFAFHHNQSTADPVELENVRQLILSLEEEILSHLMPTPVTNGDD